ncbi:MAG: asparagine synthase-related protein [Rhizobium oryzihabitans]
MVVAAQSWAEVGEPRALASASPLVAQPVVEACLRVPSWWWFAEGRNRAIAREACEGMLPDETLKRSSKGSPDSFVAELFELNRPMLRAMLLDGRLRAEGILDAQAVEQVLADPRPAVGADYRRIMRLADVEAWAANWTAPIA